MSTIADYSVFTKAFLAANNVDFSQLYTNLEGEGERAFAVIPFNLKTPLTPREAMNFDTNNFDANQRFGKNVDFSVTPMENLVSCNDADGNFIGNIVRVQPGVREGSIRLVAKVAVPVLAKEGESVNTDDDTYNTFVLVRTNPCTGMNLPIAVATISEGYNLHRHKAVTDASSGRIVADPLDDVENANYVSFTINHLNGYTSVDFNPDAYATYDDVANALSRSIDGLHIAFDTASGDLKLLDKDGNVLDQANLPIKADVIIADGEEGYKYVKTDVKQDIHAAKAWMPGGSTAWESVPAVGYTIQKAALVVGQGSSPASRVLVDPKSGSFPISTEPVQFEHVEIGNSIYMVFDKIENTCYLRKVKGEAAAQIEISNADISSYPIDNGAVDVDVIKGQGDRTCVLLATNNPNEFQACLISGEFTPLYLGTIETREGTSTGGVVGITLEGNSMYTFEGVETTITSSSNESVKWFGKKDIPAGTSLKYGLEAFVWTVKGDEYKSNDPFFSQLNASLLALGFHEGDDIALGTNLDSLAQTGENSPLNKVDADEYIHGKANKATREQEVDEQRANAKVELVAWNKRRPALTEDREHGTIIDSSGLDVRSGSITLGCGRKGEDGVFKKINYGIQMKDRSQGGNISESLDFTVSHTASTLSFDGNGHATDLTSSTLLSIEAGSYISGAPTCLILAEVTHNSNSEGDPLVFAPVRTTAGFSVAQSYGANGLCLTLQDDRDNILRLLNPDLEGQWRVPAIIEVQAIYTHPNAETVPAQQMHTYIGEWTFFSAEGTQMNHPECRFLCNKIEEWMTAVGLALPKTDPDPGTGTTPAEGVKLYVVIRVY